MTIVDIKDLRIKLDQHAEKIVSKLKDRSRLPVNKSIYVSGAIPIANYPKISFLKYTLIQKEKYFSSLGRYNYQDQSPLMNVVLDSTVKREVKAHDLMAIKFNIKAELIKNYQAIVKELCSVNEDAATFGETADCDAELLELINERILLGKFVAESKIQSNLKVLEAKTEKELRSILENKEREKEVIEKVKKIAERYEVNQEIVGRLFEWIIEKTLDFEIKYVEQKMKLKK